MRPFIGHRQRQTVDTQIRRCKIDIGIDQIG